MNLIVPTQCLFFICFLFFPLQLSSVLRYLRRPMEKDLNALETQRRERTQFVGSHVMMALQALDQK